MVNYFLVFYFLGLGLSFLSSSIMIALLLNIKYKDHSTKLRIYLAVIDVISSISLGIPFIPSSSPQYICIYNSLYYFVIMFHGFWVLYISLYLYMIIVNKNEYLKRYTTHNFFLFGFISSIFTILVLNIPAKGIPCYVLNTNSSMIIYLSVSLVSFEVVVLVIILYFYIKIRIALKKEISKIDTKSNRNRVFCLRLLGYPILFFVFTVFSELNIFQMIFIKQTEGVELFQIRILVMVYYPLFNCLLYGYTKSSKKYLWYLFMKIPDYDESQQILNDIRACGLMQDRVYLDLADISESQVFTE